MIPLRERMARTRPWLPSRLVPPADWGRLLDAAELAPADASSWCVEVHPGHRSDLLVSYTHSPPSRVALARALAAQRAPGWAPVRAIAALWADPSAALHGAAHLLWLEMDLAPTGGVPAPCIFLGLHRHPAAHPPGADDGRLPSPGVLEVLDEVWRAGLDARPPEDLRRALQQLLLRLNALPEAGRLNHLGLMWPRSTSSLRLAMEVHPGALDDCLEAIGWPGDRAALAASIPPDCIANVERLGLSLDLSPTLSPSLGLELVRQDTARDVPGWRALLAPLIERGWLLPEHRDAALAWRGVSGDGPADREVRGVYHVKLSLTAHGPPKLKLYLGSRRHRGFLHS